MAIGLLIAIGGCASDTNAVGRAAGLTSAGVVHVQRPNPGEGDDTDLLQSAIDQASQHSAVVSLAPGVYNLRIRAGVSALVPRPHVAMIGAGPDRTILRLLDGKGEYEGIIAPVIPSVDLSGFSVRDLTIDQNSGDGDVSAGRRLRAAIAIYRGHGIEIRNCRFTHLAGVATVEINGPDVEDVSIQDSRFDQVGSLRGGVKDHSTVYVHGDHVRILDNTFEARTDVDPAAGAITAIETHGSDYVVDGNTIVRYRNGMNVTGVGAPTENLHVRHNTIEGVATGIQLWSMRAGSTRNGFGLSHVLVEGNEISIERDRWAGKGHARAGGIVISPESDLPIHDVRIVDNRIIFAPSASVQPLDKESGGIVVRVPHDVPMTSSGVTVARNRVVGSYGPGIWLGLPTSESMIAGNTIARAVQTSSMPVLFRAGIAISGTQILLSVDDNSIVDDRWPSPLAAGIFALPGFGSYGLRAVRDELVATDPQIPPFQNGTSAGPFLISVSASAGSVVPAFGVAVGSSIVDLANRRIGTQVTEPSGKQWRWTVLPSIDERGSSW